MKLGIFVEPPQTVRALIEKNKRAIHKRFGDQPYLAHPPHLTLLTIDVEAHRWELAEREIARAVSRHAIIESVLADALVFFDDAMTGGHTLAYRVAPDDGLRVLQTLLLEHFQQIRDHRCSPPPNLVPWMKDSFDRSGFAFAGDNWIPHMTIASIVDCPRDSDVITNFLAVSHDAPMTIAKISAWLIRGDEHEKLVEWPLCPRP